MEEDIKVDEAFKKSFNLGYRVAAELNLKAPMLQNQEKIMPTNPMHLGMQQFIEEAKLSKNKNQEESIEQNVKKGKGKSRGRGPSL
ncbi:hypothetical protein PY092_00255 [Muricauda sp. 334s03]|uniref:Uncharacterized protein n=2 Tax=Flagellimonas TaxID=444459 RepID=A0A418NAJ2_9FLAO|nr:MULTISPECIES: hypothetical protein [Allomuricauda]MDF0714563.1 hypothetical protein [[Muricauda] yonaguniensis]RIV73258.1 hypothetical protein D2U88_03715 [Allomuricauda aequoris]TXK07070.1 hypothetical protein FQ019_03690 [Allomuricauda aequoris]